MTFVIGHLMEIFMINNYITQEYNYKATVINVQRPELPHDIKAAGSKMLTLEALNFFMETLKDKGFFFKFEIIITLLVSSF